jgi:hypothetical protein
MVLVRNPAPAWKADAVVNGGFQTSNYKDFSGFVRPVRAF